MAAVRPTYTLDNLPQGFVYIPRSNRIFTPALNAYAVLNADNSVTCPPLTYQSVDAFVKMQAVVHEIQKREELGEIKPEEQGAIKAPNSRYTHIKCLDCVIDREKLVIISILFSLLLISALCVPITYYTWPNGVFG